MNGGSRSSTNSRGPSNQRGGPGNSRQGRGTSCYLMAFPPTGRLGQCSGMLHERTGGTRGTTPGANPSLLEVWPQCRVPKRGLCGGRLTGLCDLLLVRCHPDWVVHPRREHLHGDRSRPELPRSDGGPVRRSRESDWSRGHGTPHVGGALFHWATVTSDGVRVVDVWDSREQFERFSEEKIVPAVQQAGMPAPEIQFFDVHNYLVAG